jgi:hypothetical protein
MKKKRNALRLNKLTVRALTANALTYAAGGRMHDGDSCDCAPNPGPGCSHTLWTQCEYPESNM